MTFRLWQCFTCIYIVRENCTEIFYIVGLKDFMQCFNTCVCDTLSSLQIRSPLTEIFHKTPKSQNGPNVVVPAQQNMGLQVVLGVLADA